MDIVETYGLFGEITDKLLALLGSLDGAQWDLPTCYPSWTVKDIAAHLVQTGLGRLSGQRDGYARKGGSGGGPSFEALSGAIDRSNADWAERFSSLSPRVILDLLSVSERQLADFIRTQDLRSPALYPVAWAGETASENWFDLGREYTERWHHQQQIREAAGAESLAARRYLAPVLRLFVRAVPFWYRDVLAEEGTVIAVRITGESGGEWGLVRRGEGWILEDPPGGGGPAVSMSDDTAWRFFTRTLPLEALEGKIGLSGDPALLRPFLRVRAVMTGD